MKKRWLWIIALSLSLASVALCGDIYVSGSVSGKWNTGTTVFVESAIWVDVGEMLTIEHGVEINFISTDDFVVDGKVICEGRADAPIVIKPSKSWSGFLLRDPRDTNDWNEFRYVVIESPHDLASGIIRTDGAYVKINDCNFVSRDFSLDILGGKIEAANNSFLTTGSTSRVVRLRNLETAEGIEYFSFLDHNLIQIDGTRSDTQAGPFDQTAIGIQAKVRSSLIIRENAIQLWLVPNNSIGMDFGMPEHETILSDIDENVVKVTTDSIYTAFGLQCAQTEVESNIRIEKSTFDIAVRDPSGLRHPVVAKVRNNGLRLTINSAAMRCSAIGDPTLPYVVDTTSSSTITVEYSLRWYEQTSASGVTDAPNNVPGHDLLVPTRGDRFIEAGGFNSVSDLPPGVTEHEVITDQDPGFAGNIEGDEGIWTSHDQVASYYNLLENSPCREEGDPRIDDDPNDDDLPDIGRYEYVVDPNPVTIHGNPLPTSVLISSAYPNPFNPTTSVHLELIQSGFVQMIVYDILGREVGTLLDRRLDSGFHTIGFDGSGLASGVYLLNIKYDGSYLGTQKLVLMK